MNKIKYIILFILAFMLTGCAPRKEHPLIIEKTEESSNSYHPAQIRIEKYHQDVFSNNPKNAPVETFPRYTTERILDPYNAYVKYTEIGSNEEIITDFTNTYINTVTFYNAIPEIRPYLKHFPATAKNMNMQILYLGKNSLGITAQITKKNPTVLEIIHPNEKKESIKVPVADIPELQILNINPIPRYIKEKVTPLYIKDNIIHKSFLGGPVRNEKLLFEDILKKYDLHFAALASEQGYRDTRKKKPFVCIIGHFWTQNKNLTQKEAELLVKNVHYECFQEAKKRLQEETHALPRKNPCKKATILPHEIIISISFWDEYMDRIAPPYMAHAMHIANYALISEANDIQELRIVNPPSHNKELAIENLIR